MIRPGKTTLFRMQAAALNEATRIEISQDGRIAAKMLDEPMASQVALRDDFAGIVRLIDIIFGDQALLDRLQKLMAAPRVAAAVYSSAPPNTEEEIIFDADAEGVEP